MDTVPRNETRRMEEAKIIKNLKIEPPELWKLRQHVESEKDLPGSYLKDFRICVTCKRWCQAINNLGTLKCRFHPMYFNEYTAGRNPQGTWECCGASNDPRSPYYSREYSKGCVAKDCCPTNELPFPRAIVEKDFPALLTQRLQKDLAVIDANPSLPWSLLKERIEHKGLRIHPEKNTFYLTRIDEEAVNNREIHRYVKDKKMTKLIRIRVRSGVEDIKLVEGVAERKATVLDFARRYLREFGYKSNQKDRILLHNEKNRIVAEGTTTIERLDEKKTYLFLLYEDQRA